MDSCVVVEGADVNDDLFSEWRLFLLKEARAVQDHVDGVKSSFENRDFRTNHQGISMIDPEAYDGLWRAQTTIRTTLSFLLVLLAIHVFALGAILLPIFEVLIGFHDSAWWVFVALAIGPFGVMFHYISKEFLFKKADTQVIALVESYKTQFMDSFGVDLGHQPSTKSIRWWNDDSGIYLRRPRRQEPATAVEDKATLVRSSDELEEIVDSTTTTSCIPPIFIGLVIPGDIHVNEEYYDASMTVDATAWKLLQETHREIMNPFSRTMRVWLGIVCLVFLLFVSIYGGFVFPIVILWVVFLVCTFIIVPVLHDRRNLRLYQEVSQRVTAALQREDGSADLAVEFTRSELPGRVPLNCRRYQFVRTLAPSTRQPPSTEIV